MCSRPNKVLSLRRRSGWRREVARSRLLEPRWLRIIILFTLLDVRVSSLHRGHANIICIVPILADDPRRKSFTKQDGCGSYRIASNRIVPSCDTVYIIHHAMLGHVITYHIIPYHIMPYHIINFREFRT